MRFGKDAPESPLVLCKYATRLFVILILPLSLFLSFLRCIGTGSMALQLRIEYMEPWIDLLERHGFDPAALETNEATRWMVKQRRPGDTVN